MTLLVRDEELILRDNLDYHLSRGVDFILVTDNLSSDGTPEILGEYERAGVLRTIREPADDYSQDLWVSRMAQLAVAEHGADWVFHADADEFWWPDRHRDLKAALAEVDPHWEGIEVPRQNLVPRSDLPRGGSIHRLLEHREVVSRNVFGSPLPGKVAHRGLPGVRISPGNHSVALSDRAARTAACDAITVFHFLMHSRPQFERKIRLGGAAYGRNTRFDPTVGVTWRRLYRMERAGTLGTFLDAIEFDPDRIRRGVAAGELVHDPRLANYLRSLPPFLPRGSAG